VRALLLVVRLAVVRLPEVERLPAVERADRELAARGLVDREPDEPEPVDRARRAPPPELDLEAPLPLDPPLLDCGIIPPK
jgi:hypothetical protein